MDFTKFSTLFSPARISRYSAATQHDCNKTIMLYEENLKIGQAFMPLLSVLEVVLRNKLYEEISLFSKDKYWIIDPNHVFRKSWYLSKEVTKQENDCKTKLDKNKFCNHIVSSVTFGFWVEFFTKYTFKLLRGRPIKIFRRLPAGYNSARIHKRLNEIREFRNRLYHNEPIIFNARIVDFGGCEKIHDDILEILKLLDTDLLNFIKPLDNVSSYIALAKQRII